jgi:hypothetical protein
MFGRLPSVVCLKGNNDFIVEHSTTFSALIFIPKLGVRYESHPYSVYSVVLDVRCDGYNEF